jgi:PAS domain S-box-containing protein
MMDNGTVRVLLVEDDPDDYFHTNELLAQAAGLKIKLDWAKDYDSGLAAIKNCEHDAYLLDYRLGKRDGIELLQSAVSTGCKSPMILLTGAGDRDLAIQALDAGAADYLVKGDFNATTLERTIRYSIQQSKHSEELEEKVRKRTEELEAVNTALRNSEQKYRSLFESIDEGYCIVEMIFNDRKKPIDYRFLEVSPSFEKQTGIKGAVAKTMREISPNIENSWFKIFGRVATTGEPARFENQAIQSGRWFAVHAFRFGKREDRQVAILFKDITSRKHEESRLGLLARLGEITRTMDDPSELLYTVSCAVGEHFGGRRCMFNEIDLDNDLESVTRDYYGRGVKSVAGKHKISSYSDITTAEMKAGKTVINSDSMTDPRTSNLYDKIYRASGERSYVAVPLMRGGRWVASFWLSTDKPRNWSDEEVRLLEGIAERSWLAVERLRNEAALRESEQRFATAFNSSPLAVTLTSLKTGKLIEVNETFVRMTGFSRAEAVGRSTVELGLWVHESDRTAQLAQVVSDGEIRNSEYRFRIKDGTILIGLLSAELLDLGGEQCSLTVIQDITERKHVEEALKKSEERFSRFMEYLPGLAWIKDMDGRYVYANASAQKAFRVSEENLYGKTDDQIFPPDIAAHFTANDQRAMNGGGGLQTVETLEHEDGLLHSSIVSKFPILQPDGEIGLIGGMAIDITDRIRAEQALRESEEKFRILSEAAPALIWFDDPDGNCLYVNQHYLDFSGKSLEDLTGKGWHLILHPDEGPAYLEDLHEAQVAQRAFQRRVRVQRHDGAWRWLESYAQPMFGPDGAFLGHVGVSPDITASVEAETALRESEERRHLAQNAGNVGVWDWNIVAGKTYWSESMWKLYGEEKLDINPDDSFWSAHLHASDRERVKINLEQVVASQNDEFRDEFRIIRSDGSIRWVEAVARVARDASGRALRMYGVNLDITARKDAEERIKLSENQLRLVTNAVPALISYVDSNERYRFVNEKFTEWFGTPTSEMVGKKVRDVFGLQAYRVLKPEIDQALAGKQRIFEAVLNYKDIGERAVHISYMPDIGVDGTVYGYYGLTNDLTALKRSQELLRSSEERMALMVDSLTDYAIFSIDSGGKINSWNSGAEVIFGYPQEQILGLSWEILFLPEDIARGIPSKEMRMARQKGRASDDRWHLRKDGTRFFATGVTMPLYVGKVLTGYAKIASDLTEKQRQAEQLQRAFDELEVRVKERTRELAESNLALVQEMDEREVAERQRIDLLGRLVTSQEFERRRIARDLHDQLGQRLTALRLKIASLKEISSRDEEIASRVERLQEIAEQLDSEVSFLAWELRPTALDDLGLVDAVGAFVKEWSRHYEIAADFHASGLAKARLSHDTETHLYRITQEALNNITKHAGAKYVTVLLEKRDENIILIIEDDGAGFDPGAKRVKTEAGNGLGLVGMKERATLIGGELEIESAPGDGTTIYVRVPLSA